MTGAEKHKPPFKSGTREEVGAIGYGTDWTKDTHFIRARDGLIIAAMVNDVFEPEEVKRTAGMFAKAPDMLEALQGLLAYCRDLARLQDEYPECVSKAEDVVLELTGELPEPMPRNEPDDG